MNSYTLVTSQRWLIVALNQEMTLHRPPNSQQRESKTTNYQEMCVCRLTGPSDIFGKANRIFSQLFACWRLELELVLCTIVESTIPLVWPSTPPVPDLTPMSTPPEDCRTSADRVSAPPASDIPPGADPTSMGPPVVAVVAWLWLWPHSLSWGNSPDSSACGKRRIVAVESCGKSS